MRSVETSFGRIAAYEHGPQSATPLLLINSLGTDHKMWEAQRNALSETHRLIFFDKPGHGESDSPAKRLRLTALAEISFFVLTAFNIEKASVCGLSIGGMIAMQMALSAPERVDKLVLANTAAYLPPKAMWDGRIKTVKVDGMIAITDAVIKKWFTTEFVESNRPEVERIRSMLLNADPTGYAACCAAIRDMDLRNQISAIKAPVQVLVGAADPATPPALGYEIANAIKGAKTIVLPAAHLSNIESAKAFTAAVKAHLQ